MIYVWIMLGSALGGGARFWMSSFVASQFGETFPWGTILVNISGSLVIGFFATLTGPDGVLLVGTTARQFVMIGLCGGYTTFSSFSIQTLNLVRDGDWFRAGANVAVSLLFCLFAVWLGHIAASTLNQLQGEGWRPLLKVPRTPVAPVAAPTPAQPADKEGVSQEPPARSDPARERAPDFAPVGGEIPVPPPRPRDLNRGNIGKPAAAGHSDPPSLNGNESQKERLHNSQEPISPGKGASQSKAPPSRRR